VNKVFVSGGAGFIGSHICDRLIERGDRVICFDNLMTGDEGNISHLSGEEGFQFVKGDIRNLQEISEAMNGCTHVCHQAALGSIPRSIENPLLSNEINICGSLNVLVEAMKIGVKRFVFASSSSVYGDNSEEMKRELETGNELSPYAITKSTFEDYSRVFNRINGIETIGLRYFNVFGPRQSPKGAYAAVIPIFMKNLLAAERPTIFGDGKQTRDFTYVQNTVDANIMALFGKNKDAFGRCFNVACGKSFSINEMFVLIKKYLSESGKIEGAIDPIFAPPREGDIRDSLADLSEIERCIGYTPKITVEEGIEDTTRWFIECYE